MEPFPKFSLMKNYFDVLYVLHSQKKKKESRMTQFSGYSVKNNLAFTVLVKKEAGSISSFLKLLLKLCKMKYAHLFEKLQNYVTFLLYEEDSLKRVKTSGIVLPDRLHCCGGCSGPQARPDAKSR